MAKDDYYVIVYQVLAYLYRQLKDGKPVDPDMLRHDSPLLKINESYWAYVIENLYHNFKLIHVIPYGYHISLPVDTGNERNLGGKQNAYAVTWAEKTNRPRRYLRRTLPHLFTRTCCSH